MLVGQSKNNKAKWHGLVELGDGDWRLACDTTLQPRVKTIMRYSPKLWLCQNCQAALARANPNWEAEALPKGLDQASRLIKRITKS